MSVLAILVAVSMFGSQTAPIAPEIYPEDTQFSCGVYECGVKKGANKCCYDVKNGPVCYNPESYICANGTQGPVLCGFSSGQYNGVCGRICYDKTRYVCDDNEFLVPAGDLSTPMGPSGTYVATLTSDGTSNVIVFPASSQLPTLSFSRSIAQKVIGETSLELEHEILFTPFATFNTPNAKVTGVFTSSLQFDYKYSGSPVSLDVALTSCKQARYDSCAGDLCYQVVGNDLLCPGEECDIQKTFHVELSESGTVKLDLGRVSFPLTVSFNPSFSSSDSGVVAGQATISNVALAF